MENNYICPLNTDNMNCSNCFFYYECYVIVENDDE